MYFRNFHAFRLVAALAVVVLHVELTGVRFGWRTGPLGAPIEALSLGVDFFFVLSGFLISSLLLKEMDGGGIRVKRFYLRRSLRILPLYYLGVVCVFFVGPRCGLPRMPGLSLDKDFGLQLGLYLAMSPQIAKSFLAFVPYGGQFWSIGVEIMFYLLWPIFLCRWPGLSCTLLAICLCIGIKVLSLLALGASHPVSAFLAMTRFEILAIGGAACMLHRQLSMDPKPASPCGMLTAISSRIFSDRGLWFVILGGLVVVTVVTWIWLDNAVHLVAGCLFAFLLLGSSLGLICPKILEHRAVLFLGEISYGIYLWHFIAIGIIQSLFFRLGLEPDQMFFRPLYYVGSIGLTLMISSCSYLWVEKPINDLRHRI